MAIYFSDRQRMYSCENRHNFLFDCSMTRQADANWPFLIPRFTVTHYPKPSLTAELFCDIKFIKRDF